MPASLLLTLRPATTATVAGGLGRQAHAAVLKLIAADDAALAEQLHNDEGPKPLTVSSVLGLRGRGAERAVSPEREYGLRVTLLTHALEALAARWMPERIGALEIGGVAWHVTHVARDAAESPWAGSMSYEGLAAPALLRAEGNPWRWTLEFSTPVTFRQRGMNQPLPTADLVWGSLLDKWNAFAPLALPDEVRRFALECMAVSRFDLRSAAEPGKGSAMQIGAVGTCTYVAVNRDRYWLACIETLAQFALYGGVGAATARGYGQTRLLA
jgi:CRISPR-associated endoribonuclease Cas6